MFNKIIKLFTIISQHRMFNMLISMDSSGYLYETGWVNSFKHQVPIDKEGNPLPWVTYSFIDFISDRLNKTLYIFEYGSGNSTLWYATKVNSVTSVEHDHQWFKKIKSNMPKNVDIHYQDLVYGEDYCDFSNGFDKKFDLVIVDGRDRVNCMLNGIHSLKEDGIIILDDSERTEYQKGIEFLISNNFKRIDFWGISPGLFYKKSTTIFYKSNNCLGI